MLPLDTERQAMREQWPWRLLKNPLLSSSVLLKPWASARLADASRHGQMVVLSLDQTDLGDRFAVLMLGLLIGDRAVPWAWTVEAGPANIGFAGQEAVLEQVRSWLPAGTSVLLLADRFYPSTDLFAWLHHPGWQYRLRLKGNLSVDPGFGDLVTTGELARGFMERYLSDVRLLASETPTNLGILQEPEHDEPMDHRHEWYPDSSNRTRLRQPLGDRATVFGLEESWFSLERHATPRAGSLGSSPVDYGPRLVLVRPGWARGR